MKRLIIQKTIILALILLIGCDHSGSSIRHETTIDPAKEYDQQIKNVFIGMTEPKLVVSMGKPINSSNASDYYLYSNTAATSVLIVFLASTNNSVCGWAVMKQADKNYKPPSKDGGASPFANATWTKQVYIQLGGVQMQILSSEGRYFNGDNIETP